MFAIACGAVVILALALLLLGSLFAGSMAAFNNWLVAVAPYALLWRVVLYIGGTTLYVMYWRPRLRALQLQQSDGGTAAHARLVRIERMLLVVIVAIEASNLPDLIDWYGTTQGMT